MPANTIYLFHADGVDKSKPATEDGANSLALTWEGTAAISTNFAKFGVSSVKIGGSSASRVECPAALMDFRTGDCTIDFWIRYAAHGIWHSPLNLWDGTLKQAITVGYINQPGWGFTVEANNVSNTPFYLYIKTAALNTWHHLAYVRKGLKHQGFFNGVLQTTKTTQFTAFNDVSLGKFTLGGRNGSGWDYPQDCYLDEIRVSDIARYTATFTPETAAYSIGPPPVTAVASSFDGGLKLNLDMDI